MSDSTTTPLKRCSRKEKCIHPNGPELPASPEYFPRNKNYKSGLHSWCKCCIKHYAQTHPEVMKRGRDNYHERHPTAAAEARRRYYERFPERSAQAARNWEKNHPDKKKAQDKRNYEKYKENYKARQRDYNKTPAARMSSQRSYENNRPQKLEQKKRYAKDNPLKLRVHRENMRAMRKNAPGRHTEDDILSLYDMQQGLCGYCGIRLFDLFHIEHISPVSRGGSNWPDNLLLACPRCNGSKHKKTLSEWKAVRGW